MTLFFIFILLLALLGVRLALYSITTTNFMRSNHAMDFIPQAYGPYRLSRERFTRAELSEGFFPSIPHVSHPQNPTTLHARMYQEGLGWIYWKNYGNYITAMRVVNLSDGGQTLHFFPQYSGASIPIYTS